MKTLCLILLAAQNPDFTRAMGLVGEGRFQEAHQVIESLSGGVERAQAEVFLRLRAGDLPGALRWADRGAKTAPDDLWLAERRASIAISLGAHDLAARSVDEYAAALERSGTDVSSTALPGLIDEVDKIRAAEEKRDTALTRSRFTVLASLVALLGLLAKLARR